MTIYALFGFDPIQLTKGGWGSQKSSNPKHQAGQSRKSFPKNGGPNYKEGLKQKEPLEALCFGRSHVHPEKSPVRKAKEAGLPQNILHKKTRNNPLNNQLKTTKKSMNPDNQSKTTKNHQKLAAFRPTHLFHH